MQHMQQIPNGRSKGHHPNEFDPTQLTRGTRVELEHTTDPRIAQRIAMDHLVEDPKYYVKLAKIHLDDAVPETAAVPCSHISRTARSLVGTLIGGGIGFAVAYAIMASQKPKTPALSTSTTPSQTDANAMMTYNNALERWGQIGSMVQWGTLLVGSTIGGMIGGHKPDCAPR